MSEELTPADVARNRIKAQTKSTPTIQLDDRDPLVPPRELTSEQQKIKDALIRGCSSTDADFVWVDTGQVLKVIDLAVCEASGVFLYTVETEETTTQRRKPNSIIPKAALTKTKGLSQVNREVLLKLLKR